MIRAGVSRSIGEGGFVGYLLLPSDGLGSTTELRDSSGNGLNTYTYDVWGGLRSSTCSTANQFDFTGQQTDHNANRGLQYLRARFYDPALGRFLGRDPIPFLQRYAYVGNSPLNVTDPNGLCGWCDYLGDKGADIKDGATDIYDHPGSAVQITVGTAFALTSTGDRRRVDGATVYENCRGSCSVYLSVIGQDAFTAGHSIFGTDLIDDRLLRHELIHVRQGDAYGPFWYPAYAFENLRHFGTCLFDSQCYEDLNKFEKEARQAETQ